MEPVARRSLGTLYSLTSAMLAFWDVRILKVLIGAILTNQLRGCRMIHFLQSVLMRPHMGATVATQAKSVSQL